MTKGRKVNKIVASQPVTEGAGVRLKRAFGYHDIPRLDPFLLLDDFHSENPEDYMAGFPWHPHRGIETITYMIRGEVDHGDSLGNKGLIRSGEVQWMTAGSGIIHQEMPHEYTGMMQGFQLWLNLPANKKMMNPRYRDIAKEQIPDVHLDNGVQIKIVAGEVDRRQGPVKDLVVDCLYLDITVPPYCEYRCSLPQGYKAFSYVWTGMGFFCERQEQLVGAEHLVVFDDAGDEVCVKTKKHYMRFLLVAGQPLNEPIAWGGPIVMNTKEELTQAFQELEDKTFIKVGKK
jgi:redox-sensitive bicupin YhaK (pirin superfamily)